VQTGCIEAPRGRQLPHGRSDQHDRRWGTERLIAARFDAGIDTCSSFFFSGHRNVITAIRPDLRLVFLFECGLRNPAKQ
jgi:hypothetical protein